MTWRKVAFELELDEGTFPPSPGEFAGILASGLPKEWWADHREDNWGVKAIYPLNPDGTLRQTDTTLRPKGDASELEELLTVLRNPEDANVVTYWKTKYTESLKDWKAIRDDRDRWRDRAKAAESKAPGLWTRNESVTSMIGKIMDVFEEAGWLDDADNSINEIIATLDEATTTINSAAEEVRGLRHEA